MWNIDSFKASWKESFEILRNDILILLLVSMRTLTSVYTSLMYSWILVGAFFAGIAVALMSGLPLALILLVSVLFNVVLLVAAARPSLEEKNSSYWARYCFMEWFLAGAVLVPVLLDYFLSHSSLLGCYVGKAIAVVFCVSPQVGLIDSHFVGLWVVFFSPFIINTILFMDDSKSLFGGFFKAVGRATSMFIYNYPFFLSVYLLFRLILSGFLLTLMLFSSYVPIIPLKAIGWIIFLVVMYPYYVCLITNFYLKRLHEQFAQYFAR